ncbi:Protein kinase, ATP binding site-containing protein [Artemisia annua]|uniref:Protein kinase, ATP binding site-containing protein n=1 Tax=Artemisia annua TaxID=35608 RepID=A0A2U1Q7A6_ARTAN|nr:Protein kinase, ATP binding site-containing protein [Artemisia annua]
MSSPKDEFAHLRIPLEIIQSATNNFDEKNVKSTSGIGNRYTGQLLWSGELINIIARRLNKDLEDGEQMFWMEISMLSSLKHKNLVSLIGFSDENGEKIIITRHDTRGSLYNYLSDPMSLTWVRRLEICVGLAHALSYIHYDEQRDFSFQHLKIELQAIKSATNEFNDSHCIGRGGFGKVYKGELVLSKGKSVVALKRLNRAFGQGDPEFWKEIIMLSLYKHDNIVSLLGFCDDCGEKILIYEYASKKSLDLYLNDKDLTWVQRLEICIGAARGLAYLHNPGQTQQRVLHRDIKSSNILLDENWNARIADLGLSKFGPANQQYSFLVSNAVGTFGYWDPLYAETGFLTKESDVYSFGVVLFEMLCGRLCIRYNQDKPLTILVRECYKQKTINDIVYANIKDEINPHSLKAFTTVAYQCLKREADQRPFMTKVVKVLETALSLQNEDIFFDFLLESFSSYCGDGGVYVEGIEFRAIDEVKHEEIGKLKEVQQVLKSNFNMDLVQQLPSNFEEIFNTSRNYDELFWLGEVNEKKLLVLSAKAVLYKFSNVDLFTSKPLAESRFQEVIELLPQQVFHLNCTIKSQMLSPDTEYVCYLVFKLSEKCQGLHCPVEVRDILHKENNEAEFVYFITPSPLNINGITRVPKQREDGWMEIQVWKFNSTHEFKDDSLSMNMKFTSHEGTMSGLIVCGLEFRPL